MRWSAAVVSKIVNNKQISMLDFTLLQPTQVSLFFFFLFKAGTPQQCVLSGKTEERTFDHKHTWVTVAIHSLKCFRASFYSAGTRHITNMNHTQNVKCFQEKKYDVLLFHLLSEPPDVCTPSIQRQKNAYSCEMPDERPHHKITLSVTFLHSSVKITFFCHFPSYFCVN